jgi:hypothetical protein
MVVEKSAVIMHLKQVRALHEPWIQSRLLPMGASES